MRPSTAFLNFVNCHASCALLAPFDFSRVFPIMTERIVQVNSELVYNVLSPTTMLLQISSMQTPHQFISNEQLRITPAISIDYLPVGPLGIRACRLMLQPGVYTISYAATATLTPALPATSELNEIDYVEMPAEVLPFLNPSRYCESDRLMKFAADLFGQATPGFNRVQQIVDWVYNALRYTPGSTGTSTTACDVLLQREGVCRDYAHVAITLCRALGIPARYISGYAVELNPPDFHGFFEVYLGGDWVMFDATKLAPVSGFVRIGAGRDAADVAFATLIGQASLQSMTVMAADTPSSKGVVQHEAISTA
jgi:transglutaminase-like putative cysteine protease